MSIRFRIGHRSFRTERNRTCGNDYNKAIFFDPYKKNHSTGSFILIDPITNNTVAVGMIIDKLNAEDLPSKIVDEKTLEANKSRIHKGECLIPDAQREKRYNQKGTTLWVTGLHGSGKNELAFTLEKELFDAGATVVLLDGSSIRLGLSNELDYSPADRAEHLRRVAHISKLLNDQGIITICSFISPDENIRKQVVQIIGEDRFKLIHMDADWNSARKINRNCIRNLKKDWLPIYRAPIYNIRYLKIQHWF